MTRAGLRANKLRLLPVTTPSTFDDYPMTRGRKANKLRKKNNDYLSQLSSDILSMIISMLDLKDAVKTSVLSKRWRYVWANHPNLSFNHLNILGLDYDQLNENWESGDSVFVKFVDQIMEQRSKGINQINSFCVKFELGKHFCQSIDRWISCAVQKGAETIDLDLSRFPFNLPPQAYTLQRFEKYNFSLLRTVSKSKGSLKHLRLAFCNFRGRSCSKKFNSLVSLHFQSVNISTFQLTKVLEGCPLLEKLSLHSCPKLNYLTIGDCNNKRLKILCLNNLKIREIDFCAKNLNSLEFENVRGSTTELANYIKSCPLLEQLSLHSCILLDDLIIGDTNNHLKILSLKDCFGLTGIDLCVSNLHTFECVGLSRRLSLKIQAPRLVNTFIFENKLSRYPVTRMCLDIPKLENLVLTLELSLEFFGFRDDSLPEFSNVRRLALLGFPAVKKCQLSLVSYIFKSFPLLQTLELNLEGSFSGTDAESKETEKKDDELKKCANGTITKLELNGFVGSQRHIDLLKYLLQNLKGLKVLAMGPSYKQYKSFNGWSYSKPNVWGKRWFQFESKWLRELVPPCVRLEFQ